MPQAAAHCRLCCGGASPPLPPSVTIPAAVERSSGQAAGVRPLGHSAAALMRANVRASAGRAAASSITAWRRTSAGAAWPRWPPGCWQLARRLSRRMLLLPPFMSLHAASPHHCVAIPQWRCGVATVTARSPSNVSVPCMLRAAEPRHCVATPHRRCSIATVAARLVSNSSQRTGISTS